MTDYSGFRATLHSPDPLNAVILSFTDPGVASVLGWSGADYVIIDCEHGAFTLESVRACIEALASTPAAAVVRVAGNEGTLIKQVLDLGADGVQIPTVGTAEEAAAAVSFARYAPLGKRGVGVGRASGYGRNFAEYVGSANDSIGVIVMLETVEGIRNAEAIAAVAGVDGIVIGPADLAVDQGNGINTSHPDVIAAFERVLEVGAATGVKVGVGGPASDAAHWRERGAGLFMYFIDTTGLAAAARASVEAVNAAIKKRG